MPGKLAALVRKKYPGMYDDMDDNTLESSVLKKHPEYADLITEDVGPDASMNIHANEQHAEMQPHHTSYMDALSEKYGPVISDVWGKLNTPLVKFNVPQMESKPYQPGLNESVPSAMLHGFTSGATEGLKNIGKTAQGFVEGISSPLSVGLGITGLASRAAGALGQGSRFLNRAVGGGMVAHGGYNAVNADSTGGKLGGLAEAGLGAFGYKHAGPKPFEIMNPATELYHGTSESNYENIINSGKFDPNFGHIAEHEYGPHNPNRQYDYSVAGPDAIYLTDRKDTWLNSDWADDARASKYDKTINTKLDSKTKIVTVNNIGELNRLAKQAGFKNAHDFGQTITVDGLRDGVNPEDLLRARNAIEQFKLKTGYDGINLAFDDEFNPENMTFEKIHEIENPFGGRQVILFDPSKASPKINPQLPPEFIKPGSESAFNASRAGNVPKPDVQESAFANVANKQGMQVHPPEPIDNMIATLQRREGAGQLHPEAQTLLKKLIAKKAAMNVVKESSLPQVAGPVEKLINALDEATPLADEQKLSFSAQRVERLKKMEQVKTKGLAGHYERIGHLAGKYDTMQMEPLVNKLEPEDVDHLVDAIQNDRTIQPFQKTNATTGLIRMLHGELPRDYERNLLSKVFGETFAGTIEAKLPLIDQKRSLVSEVVNLPRALQSSMDMSAPLRQGLPLIHRKEWWTSWDDMVKSFGSEKAFQGVQESIQSNPHFELGQESGLKLTDLVNAREEQMASSIAEKVPGVRASNRAYTAFLNKLRQDTFSRLVEDAVKLNTEGKSGGITGNLFTNKIAGNPLTDRTAAEAIADYVNTSTGRGDLGRLEKSASTLNAIFFSPRLIASRVKMLTPQYYVRASPMVRKEAIKSLLAVAGAGSTLAGLGKLAGADVGLDPTNADFGKMKFGDTRLDPFGGFQQYIVAATRLLRGETTSSTTSKTTDLTAGQFGKPTRKDILQRFGESKLSPPISFVLAMLNGKDYSGAPLNVPVETLKLFTPMMLQDLAQIVAEDPDLLHLSPEDMKYLALAPNAFGMGLQKYGPN